MSQKRAFYRVHDKVIYMSFKRACLIPSVTEQPAYLRHQKSATVIMLASFRRQNGPTST